MKKTRTVQVRAGGTLFLPTRVLAAPGGKPTRKTGDDAPFEVPECRFVRRRLAAGDLVEHQVVELERPARKGKGKGKANATEELGPGVVKTNREAPRDGAFDLTDTDEG